MEILAIGKIVEGSIQTKGNTSGMLSVARFISYSYVPERDIGSLLFCYLTLLTSPNINRWVEILAALVIVYLVLYISQLRARFPFTEIASTIWK